jgi:hypothetical protein
VNLYGTHFLSYLEFVKIISLNTLSILREQRPVSNLGSREIISKKMLLRNSVHQSSHIFKYADDRTYDVGCS